MLFRSWSRDAAPTWAVLGRTLGGYLFVPIELALIVGFYFVTNRFLGWWQPSESLSDPNILGSALPGLAPIGMALQAGFLEECLFRAVPLSLAALIGARFRRSTRSRLLRLGPWAPGLFRSGPSALPVREQRRPAGIGLPYLVEQVV